MDKRGSVFLWFLLGLVAIIFIVFVVLIFIGDDSSAGQDENNGGTDSGTTEPSQEGGEVEACEDYLNQEACGSDSSNVSQINCSESETCNCVWNVNSSVCELFIEGDVEVSEGEFFDLEALSVTAEDGGCELIVGNLTNHTVCAINSVGKLKNSGTTTIEERFVVQFLAVEQSGSSNLIEAFGVEESFGPGQEKELSTSYTNISHGDYFIRLIVDAVSNIDEIDETNNAKSAFIKI